LGVDQFDIQFFEQPACFFRRIIEKRAQIEPCTEPSGDHAGDQHGPHLVVFPSCPEDGKKTVE
jgi:hypothetical protein